MKIEKNKLVKVFWKSEEFENFLCIDDVDGLILDTIKVFGKRNDTCQEVPFDIKNINGKTFIYPQMYFHKFYILAEKVTNANVLKINSEDYVQHYSTMGETFEFALKDDVEVG